MAWRKWLVRSLVFTVAGGLAVAVAIYLHWTNPDAVRRQVVARLAEHLPGATVSLEAARLRLLGGIAFSELRLRRRDDPHLITFADVPRGTIFHDKEQLVNGRLAIRKIEWYQPTLRLIRRKDGTWNLDHVLGPVDPNERIPTIELQQGTILFEDQRDGTELPPLEIKDVNLTIVNDPQLTLVFNGSGVTNLDGPIPIQITGTLGRVSEELSLAVQLPNFAVGGNLVQRLAAAWPEAAAHLRLLTGVASLRADLGYHPRLPHPWSYDVRGQLTQGKFRHAELPLPLDALQARFRCLDGQVTLEELRARSGPAQILASGKAQGLSALAQLTGSLRIEHLPLTDDLFARLPACLRDIPHNFAPQGAVTLAGEFERRAGQWARLLCSVYPEDLAAVFAEFPYRLEHLSGSIDHQWDRSRGTDRLVVQLVGYSGAQPVYIQGALEGPEPSAVDFKIWGKNIPLDEKLLRALPPECQRVAASFNPTGQVDIVAFVRRPQGSAHFANRYLAHFHDTTLAYEVFPYPVENVRGTLDIRSEQWQFHDFCGTHKGGEFRGHGGSLPAPAGERLTIALTGRNIRLDPELQAALKKPALKAVWAKLSPSGRMDFEARIEQAPGQSEPDIAVDLNLLGCGIRPDFFPYELRQLRGAVHYHHQQAELHGFVARHGPTVLTAEAGKVSLRPDGHVAVDLVDLIGNPIVPDGDFLAALPPALGRACTRLGLHDPLSLRTNLTVDVPPDNAPAHIYWDGGVRVKNATLRAGLPLEHVSGLACCRGEHRGAFGAVVGNLELEEATLFRQPLTRIHSQLIVREQEPEVLQLPNLKAGLFGGDVGGAVRVEFGPSLRYRVNLTASQIQLQEFARHNALGPEAEMSGLAGARLYLEGEGTEPAGLEGHGSLDVPSGKMYNLPLLLDLLKVLNLRPPDKTAFEEARVRFAVHGPQVEISRLDLYGNAVSLSGQGTMNLDSTDLNLEFYAFWGHIMQWSPPILDKIPPWISQHLLKIRMRGPIGKVSCTKEVPILVEPVKELLKRMNGKADM